MTSRPPRRVRTMPTLVARTPRSWASRSARSSLTGARRRGGGAALAAHELLGLADGELPFEHDLQDGALQLGDGQGGKGTAVALADAAIHDGLARLGSQLQQAERIRDRDPALPDLARDGLVREPEAVDQLAVGGRFLDGIQVRALDVLDQRQLQHRAPRTRG